MLDKVLLVITGDFGRTPKVNDRGGRDYWPRLCTPAFAGGGMCSGQIIGRSAVKNDIPASDGDYRDRLLGSIQWQLRPCQILPRISPSSSTRFHV